MKGDTNQFDTTVRDAIHNHATPLLTSIMQGFSFLVGLATGCLICCLLVVRACFYFKRVPELAAFLAIA